MHFSVCAPVKQRVFGGSVWPILSANIYIKSFCIFTVYGHSMHEFVV